MKKYNEKQRKRFEKNLSKNRKFKKIFYNRTILFLFLTALQLLMSALILLRFYEYGGSFILVGTRLVAFWFVLHIINKNSRTVSKISWIVVILVFPLFGILFYLLYGEGKSTRKIQKKLAEEHEKNRLLLRSNTQTEEKIRQNGRTGQTCNFIETCGGYPAFDDGNVEYFPCGELLFEEMKKALDKAKKFILMEYFIVTSGKMWSEIIERLKKKAEQGVKVFFIYDAWGTTMTLPYHFDGYMESLNENIKCMAFNRVAPVFSMRLNNRDHRKIFVVDGEVAITGGINLADEYINEISPFGYWKDTGVKITGNAVNSFTMMFFSLWNAFREKEDVKKFLKITENGKDNNETNPMDEDREYVVQPFENSPFNKEFVGENVYLDMIWRAKKCVYITTPYLITDEFLTNALCTASKRGVDVKIIVPGIPDKKLVYRMTRTHYKVLRRAGVEIYEYSPGFVHAKSILIDDNCAVVGTMNLDHRSFTLQMEDGVYFTGCKAVADVKADMEKSISLSKAVPKDGYKRNAFGKMLDAVLRVFETLF